MPVSLSCRKLSTVLKTDERSPHYFYTTGGWREIDLTGNAAKAYVEKNISNAAEDIETLVKSGRQLPKIATRLSTYRSGLKDGRDNECKEAVRRSELEKLVPEEPDIEEYVDEEELESPVCKFLESVKRTAAEVLLAQIDEGEEDKDGEINVKEDQIQEVTQKEDEETVDKMEEMDEEEPFRHYKNRVLKHVNGLGRQTVFPSVSKTEPLKSLSCKEEWKTFRSAVSHAIAQREACNKAIAMKTGRRQQWADYTRQKRGDADSIDEIDMGDGGDLARYSSMIGKKVMSSGNNSWDDMKESIFSDSMVTHAGSMSSMERPNDIRKRIMSSQHSQVIRYDEPLEEHKKETLSATRYSATSYASHLARESCSFSEMIAYSTMDIEEGSGELKSDDFFEKGSKAEKSKELLKSSSSSTSMITMAGSRTKFDDDMSLSFDRMYGYYGESYDGIMHMPLYPEIPEEVSEINLDELEQQYKVLKVEEESVEEEEVQPETDLKKGVSDSGSFYYAPSDFHGSIADGEDTTTIDKHSISLMSSKTKTKREKYFDRLKTKFKFFTQDEDGVIHVVPREDIDESYKEQLKKYYHLCKHTQSLKLEKTKDDSSSLEESQEGYLHEEDEGESRTILTPFTKCVKEVDALRKQQSDIRRQKVAQIIEDDRQYQMLKVAEFGDERYGEMDDQMCRYELNMKIVEVNEYEEEYSQVPSYQSYTEHNPQLNILSEEQCKDLRHTTISDSSVQDVDLDDVHSTYAFANTHKDICTATTWKQMIYRKVIFNLLKRTVNVMGEQMSIEDILGPEKVDELLKFKVRGLSVSRYVRNDSREDFRAVDYKIDKEVEIYGEDSNEECAGHTMLVEKDWHVYQDRNKLMSRLLDHMVDDILNGPKASNTKKIVNLLEIAAEVERSRTDANKDAKVTDKNLIKYREKTLKTKDVQKGIKECKVEKQFIISELQNSGERLANEDLKSEQNFENESSTEKIQLFHMVTTKGPIRFPSGGKYFGNWNKMGMESCGVYQTPDGILIECQMNDGRFDGETRVTFPNGTVIHGTYVNNKFHHKSYTFKDGLPYERSNWKYLQWPDRRFWSEIVNNVEGRDQLSNDLPTRKVPNGCIDTGEGFYCPTTKYIHHPRTLKPIRIPTEEEELKITYAYRKGWEECVSQSHHLHEFGLRQIPKQNNPFSRKSIPPDTSKKNPDRKEGGAMLDKLLSLKPANPSGQEILESITKIFSPGSEEGAEFTLAAKVSPTQYSMREKFQHKQETSSRRFKNICFDIFGHCKLKEY